MKLPRKWQWLLLGLALVAAGTNMPKQESDAKPLALTLKQETERKSETTQTASPGISTTELSKMGKRSPSENGAIDIFNGKSWYVPPPPPKPAPPPKPTAPPVPYTFMGRYQGDDGRMVIFLTKGDRVYSVSPGDVLEGIYRVGEIASGQLVLIYLPLNVPQTISIGEAS